MISNINSNTVAGMSANGVQKRPAGQAAGESSAPDATVQVQYDSLASKAVDSDIDAQAVEKAKEMLASGQLDTPENIREAAAAMVQYGV